VEFLLQVGANIEEMPAQLGDIYEPGPFTALYKAVQGQYVEIVRLLLEHGAICGYALWNTTGGGKAARRQSNSRILNLLE
jgi:hypothetical protein